MQWSEAILTKHCFVYRFFLALATFRLMGLSVTFRKMVVLGLWLGLFVGAKSPCLVAAKETAFSGSTILHFQLTGGFFAPQEKKIILKGTLSLAKGWHVYGKGASWVEPARLKFTQPFSVADAGSAQKATEPAIKVHWPQPVWGEKSGMRVPFYANEVPLTLEMNPKMATDGVVIKGALEAAACSEVECRLVSVPFAYRVRSTEKGVEIQSCDVVGSCGLSLWILLFAFLGGVILNFMPCVLPVLGVKLLVFTKKACPRGFFPVIELWMTVLGIFSAFMLLALGAIILKLLGASVGWGLHFQNPYFLSSMVVLVTLFTANVWELFDIALPHIVQTSTSSLVMRSRAFFTGVLSVLLATPCTAPFVGTAVGFALSQDAFHIFLVFACLAAGFSSPYWLAAMIPSHHLRLPKPGAWLLWLRRVLSLLLVGTLLWLTYLLTAPFGWMAFTVLLGVASLGWCLLLVRQYGHGILKKNLFKASMLLWIVCLGASPLWQPWLFQKPAESLSAQTEDLFKAFEPEKIPALVQAGKTVFVDITAVWCLLCQFNKTMVLENRSVKQSLKHPSVVCMRADWTRAQGEKASSAAEAKILAFLKRFGKAGIPFNVVFGPNAKEGLVLPEVLTQKALEEALLKAQGDT